MSRNPHECPSDLTEMRIVKNKNVERYLWVRGNKVFCSLLSVKGGILNYKKTSTVGNNKYL